MVADLLRKPPPNKAGRRRSITVTIEGGKVTPNGDRIDVDAGQDVELDITADAPGEIHVHSDPPSRIFLEYRPRASPSLTITCLEQPGTVDVEVHQLEMTSSSSRSAERRHSPGTGEGMVNQRT